LKCSTVELISPQK